MSDVSIKSARKITSCIEGWLTDREGELLYKLARKCSGKGVIVEIGSWKGKSTIWLGRGALDGNKVKVYAIDPHAGYCKPKKVRATKHGALTCLGKTLSLRE